MKINDSQVDTDFHHGFKKIMTGLLEKGMETPFLLVTMASNGSLINRLTWSDGGFHCERISSNCRDDVLEHPINIVLVDAKDKVVRMEIKRVWLPRAALPASFGSDGVAAPGPSAAAG